MSELEHPDLAARLRGLTPARVGLGRTGVSQQTRDLLAFNSAHAQARDAVHARLEAASLAAQLGVMTGTDVLVLHSAASSRALYLQRPDLGRVLSEASRAELATRTGLGSGAGLASGAGQGWSGCDVAFIVADGLSALAVERHCAPLIQELLPRLEGWRVAPLTVVEQGRVAIGDEIGAAFGAAISVVVIGERPGLSSPDSLGAYVTWNPRPGRTDAERNCISNIRTEGLSYAQAAADLFFYLNEARRRHLTGVALKMESRILEARSPGKVEHT